MRTKTEWQSQQSVSATSVTAYFVLIDIFEMLHARFPDKLMNPLD